MTEDNYSSLQALLAQFGRGGLRRKDITEGDSLTIEKCRLEIVNAVLTARKGRSKFNGQLLVKAMVLVFPKSYNSAGRLGCSACINQDLKRLENEVAKITEKITRLGGKVPEPIESHVAEPAKPQVAESLPVATKYLHIGQPCYVVTGQAGSSGVEVGIVVQQVPQVLVRMLTAINSRPVEVSKDRVFADLRDAHNSARELHGMAVELTTTEQPQQPADDAVLPATNEAPQDNAAQLASVPKKGQLIDNGDIQCKVDKVSAKDSLIHLIGEIQSITFEQFHQEWAVVPK